MSNNMGKTVDKKMGKKLSLAMVAMVLGLGLNACSHDSQKAESELGKQAKATEDKAVSQINQANADTAKKMDEVDKATQ